MVNSARGQSQGGSTITQQLAKLNYVGSNRTFLRKFKEVLYASKLESKYSKDQLLERYINQVYFGEGAYGIALAVADVLRRPAGEADAGPGGHAGRQDPVAERPRPLQGPGHRAVPARPGAAQHGQARLARRAPSWSRRCRRPWASAPGRSTGRGVGSATKAPDFVAFVGREAAEIDALGSTADARRKQAFTGGYTIETTVDLKATDAAVESAKALLGAAGDPTTAIASVAAGRRRHPGAVRRARPQPGVRPGQPGPAPAGVVVQALRLPGHAEGRDRPPLAVRLVVAPDPALRRRPVDGQQLRGRGPGDDRRRRGHDPLGQRRLRPAHGQGRARVRCATWPTKAGHPRRRR